MAKFKQETLDAIKDDPFLFASVAKEMNVKAISLGVILDRNSATLNRYSVVKLVADHLQKAPEDLLEVESEVKEAQSN